MFVRETQDINENCTISYPKKGRFPNAFANLWFFLVCFDLKLMHDWEAVGLRIRLAPTNYGNSVPAQSYDFGPLLKKTWYPWFHTVSFDIFALFVELAIPHILNISNHEWYLCVYCITQKCHFWLDNI